MSTVGSINKAFDPHTPPSVSSGSEREYLLYFNMGNVILTSSLNL